MAGAGGGEAAGRARLRGRAAAAPGPAVRLPGAGRPGRAARARLPGAGALRRPAGRRVAAGAGRATPSTTASWPTWRRSSRAEPVLRPEVARLARAVADRYAGSLADVLRLAVPPRHARVESRAAPTRPPPEPASRTRTPGRPRSGWAALPGRAGVPAARWRDGRAPRAVLVGAAGRGLAGPARRGGRRDRRTAGGARSSVVPDARDLDRLDAALTALLGAGPARRAAPPRSARPSATGGSCGPAAGEVPVVDRHPGGGVRAGRPTSAWWRSGTTATTCTPSRARPYPHAREVLLTRAQLAGAAALVGGYARTAEAQLLVETGWAKEIARRPGDACAARAPAVAPTGDDPQLARDPAAVTARLPSLAWRAARDALAAGAPVLVQVPRRGYLPSVSCADCRTPARCPHCAGPLELRSAARGRRPAGGAAGRPPTTPARLRRAAAAGRGGRAPGVPPRSWAGPSPACRCAPPGRDEVLDHGAGRAGAGGGHAGRRAGGRGRLRRGAAAGHLGAADPGRPAGRRGGAAALAAAAALARPAGAAAGWWWSPTARWRRCRRCCAGTRPGFAARELAERRELGFPPAARMASADRPAGGGRRAARRGPAAGRAPRCSGPVPVGEDRSGCWSGSPRSAAARWPRRCTTAAGGAQRPQGAPSRCASRSTRCELC